MRAQTPATSAPPALDQRSERLLIPPLNEAANELVVRFLVQHLSLHIARLPAIKYGCLPETTARVLRPVVPC
jgi:hypothetical protein